MIITISHIRRVRIYCLLMMLLMLAANSLFDLFIKSALFITSTIENSDEFSSAKINSNWAYSQIGESLTISVGWSSTTFPSIGSSFNLNPNGLLYPMPNLPTQPCCTLHQQISSLVTTYISR